MSRGRKHALLILAISLMCVTGTLFFLYSSQPDMKPYKTQTAKHHSFVFQKEGTLMFIDRTTGAPITDIDIEIADTPSERTQGLMYRQSLEGHQGMLFIHEKQEVIKMWMKNTFISLDIIFVNKDFEIVAIQRNTEPLSQRIISSGRDALYAVEVVSGFCATYNIKEGDRIRFQHLS